LKLFVSFLIARYIVHTFNHAVSDSSRIAHKLFKIFLFNVNIDTRDFSNINFNYIVNPAPDQNELTGVPPFPGRPYRIKIIVDDGSHSNTQPVD
jgi:hypothetical protein